MKNLVAQVVEIECLGFQGPCRRQRNVGPALNNPVTAIETIYRDGRVRVQCPYFLEGICKAAHETRRQIECPYAKQ